MNMHNSASGHITDDEFFEYLDQQLAEEQIVGVESHLEFCPTCAQRLAEHNALILRIEAIPEKELGLDLTPGVLSAIKKRDALTPIWWWLLIFQGILALGLIVFAAPSILNNAMSVSTLKLGKDFFTLLATNLSFWFQEWNSLIDNSSQLFTFDISLSLGLPLNSILWLLLLATLTWIIGNSILLRPQFTQSEQ